MRKQLTNLLIAEKIKFRFHLQAKREKTDADDENVEKIEAGPHESALVEEKTVGNDFDHDL